MKLHTSIRNGTLVARACIRNRDKTRSFNANGRSGTPFVAACKNGSGSCWKTTVISPKNIHSFRAHYPYRPAPLLAVSFPASLSSSCPSLLSPLLFFCSRCTKSAGQKREFQHWTACAELKHHLYFLDLHFPWT